MSIKNKAGNVKVLNNGSPFTIDLVDGVQYSVDLGAAYTVLSLGLYESTGKEITAFEKELSGGNPTQYILITVFGAGYDDAELYVTAKI